MPGRSRGVCSGPILLLLLVFGACSSPEPSPSPPPPEKLNADHVAGALGGRPHTARRAGPTAIVPDEFLDVWEPWSGDLDGIVRRRLLRVLVTFNSTDFFVNRGRQGGITYEMFRLLEKDLNQRFSAGSLAIDVLFMPVTRDRLIPALLEGHGDLIAANLTITEGRQRLVDFSAPVRRGVEEVVVTGPGAPSLATVEDLSGQSVYIRLSSSYAESIGALNADFEERGLQPVTVIPVDERLEDEDVLDMVNAGVFPIAVVDDYYANLWARVLDDVRVHRDVTVGSGGGPRLGHPPREPSAQGLCRRLPAHAPRRHPHRQRHPEPLPARGPGDHQPLRRGGAGAIPVHGGPVREVRQ